VEGEAKNTFRYDPDYCKGCGNCLAVCTAGDIEIVPEDKNEKIP
jgi:Pyruvate/2-oxoacid:ferredoxin oxidoreductase delta subunit